MQHPTATFTRVSAKAAILLAAWIIVSAAPAIAILLWRRYGGSVYPPEILAVAAGHLLNAGLTIALAAAAASSTEHPSTAAILALAITVGTWIINFVAAVQGGWWERMAGYTPTSMVAEFQHGLIRMDVVLIASALIVAGLALCAIWMRLGIAVRRRAYESVALVGATAALVAMSTFATASWDLSENRGNSFPRADEEALERIQARLKIEVHLAPQDPRRSDLERRALRKTPPCASASGSATTCRRPRSGCSSRRLRNTVRFGTSSTASAR